MPSHLRIAALGVMLVAYPLVASAQVPQSYLGTWTMDIAKSKSDPDPLPKSNVVRWEVVPGGGARNVGDVVDAVGKVTHNELVTMFDGKEAELKGAAVPTTRAYRRIDDRTYEYVQRVNGKVTTTTRSTMAADNKTRTLVTTGVNAAGKPVNTMSVWVRK